VRVKGGGAARGFVGSDLYEKKGCRVKRRGSRTGLQGHELADMGKKQQAVLEERTKDEVSRGTALATGEKGS